MTHRILRTTHPAAQWLLATSLLVSSSLALAAGTTGADYEVELVVFENRLPDLEGNEVWSPDRVDRNIEGLEQARAAADARDDQTTLGKAMITMAESGDYHILAHKRWTQTAEARSTSPVMRIKTEDGELDGTFTFFMSRFLHVDVELLLRDPNALPEGDPLRAKENAAPKETNKGATATTASTGVMEPEPVAMTQYYRISESRRIRSKEIHYFDHPKFGVLVLITPKEDVRG